MRHLLSPLPLLLLLAGCSPLRDNDAKLGDPGEACTETAECGSGLVCSAGGLCAPPGEPGTAGPNAACTADTDCRIDLICSGAGRCAATDRRGEDGDVCFSDATCEAPLLCGHDGRCAAPGAEGTVAIGAGCTVDADCGFGLVCDGNSQCAERPRWGGVECPAVPMAGSPRVLHEVPRGAPAGDFFGLPFPDDARRVTQGLDLTGYPGLEQAPQPAGLIGTLMAEVGPGADGFGVNSAVLFRFSAPMDYDTLTFGGDDASFAFIDLTEGASYGRRPRSRFFATTDRAPYICHNWLGIRPSEGSPLEASHTYGALFFKGLTDSNGVPFEPDADLVALLAETPPSHPAMVNAWNRYAPLRRWLATEGVPAEDVLGAAVFTTADPTPRAAALPAAVAAAPEPVISDMTECDGGTPSPCAGPGGRRCGDVNPLYGEYHARVALPDFLTGVPPYRTWGGTFDLGADGAPRVQRQSQACLAMTVPRGPAPAGGWPTVIYAPDLGEGFRAFIDNGFANRLARLGWAVISVEPLLDGARFGEEAPPEAATLGALLNDVLRPARARDLVLQSAAELHAVVRLLSTYRVPTADGNQRFSGEKLAFFGQGRGAWVGVPFLAYAPTVDAAVLSSAGAGWIDTLRFTTAPHRPGYQLAVELADDGLNGMHPGLHLVQAALDPADPMNFGGLIRRPPEGVTPKHVLHIVGLEDGRTPYATANHLAIALRLQRVGSAPDEFPGVDPAEAGAVRGNVDYRSAGLRTQVVKLYAPDGGDGAQVAFELQPAIADVGTFFRTLLEDPDGVPTVNP
ncbi:MAG: hypothetical protein H6702_00550 [Myxococcales bacterium]|nr:hypothetical protein [Myxococcales bacterium]